MVNFINLLLELRLFDIKVINPEDFAVLFFRFLFNSVFVVTIVRFIYYPITKRKDYLFTYLLFSVVVFFLCHLLSSVKLEMGFALGLFAIFGIIRYRTDAIPIKEMTYLFITIGVSAINALANKKVSHAELLFTNIAVLAFTYLLEKVWLLKHESYKVVLYENIELIVPENHAKLMEDLKTRTGLDIHRIEIGKIDFLRDVANIKIFFFDKPEASSNYEELSE